MFVKKRPEHKTSLRTLVSNTMNCNCISILEGTSKLVKRLKQVFLLIKQSIPLFALLLCHFRFLKTIRLLFWTHRVVLKSSVFFTLCILLFLSFRLAKRSASSFCFCCLLDSIFVDLWKMFLFNFYNKLLLKLQKYKILSQIRYSNQMSH